MISIKLLKGLIIRKSILTTEFGKRLSFSAVGGRTIVSCTSPEEDNDMKQSETPAKSINQKVLKKSAIARLNEESVAKTLNVLNKYGFKNGVTQECPDLLSIPPAAIENYILIFRETGLECVRPFMLATFPSLMKKTLTALRKLKIIPDNVNILENYIKNLDISKKVEHSLLSAIPRNYNEFCLLDLRLLFLQHFLAEKFQTKVETIQKLIVKYPRCKHRSFTWYLENIQILRENYEFSDQIILKHGYLLQANPNNLKAIFQEVSTLGGMPLHVITKRRPKILMSSVSNLLETNELLKQHKIRDESVKKYPDIFTLSSKTIASRLQAFDETPQLIPFKTHPRVCRLLYYFTKVKRRLNYLESLEVSGVSLHILSIDKEKFAKYIQLGEIRNKGADVIYFLSDYLKLTRERVRENISVHPHWLQVPAVYLHDVIHYLISTKGISKEQIGSCLPILLYPIARVKEETERVEISGEATKTDTFFLHMVLYYLEKKFHFTGDGIWTTYHQSRHNFLDKEHLGLDGHDENGKAHVDIGSDEDCNSESSDEEEKLEDFDSDDNE